MYKKCLKTTQIINSISDEGNWGSGMRIYFTVYPSMCLKKLTHALVSYF